PKGYARKLVPKFIGPCKILKDFGNSTFKMDLPSRLKQRGVHNVFSPSLSRIHIPNDDCLFPWQLETQRANLAKLKECAVAHILYGYDHKSNALFQMKWKSGDLAWLPYQRN
ncbi:hypothetical protein BDP27DRAFT_1231129, partial [Rhodocollybia butyracea]